MAIILDGTLGETFPSWTTAGRPASPAVGQMGYNTTTGLFDQYTASGWVGSLTNASQSIPKSALPTGSVLQVVQTQLTSVQSFSTTAYTFINVTGAAVTITPSSASNKILVMYSCMAQTATPGAYYATYTRITRNGTAVGIGGGSGLQTGAYAFAATNQYGMCVSQVFLDSPATTSAVTYQLQVTGESGTDVVGGSYNAYPSGASPQPNVPTTIIVMEIAA